MKNNKLSILFVIFLFILFLSVSCRKEPLFQVTKEMEANFNARFPDVENLEWSGRKGFVVAEFREDGRHRRAWFSTDGHWVMTETMQLKEEELPKDAYFVDFSGEKGYTKSDLLSTCKVEFDNLEDRYIFETKKKDTGEPLFLFYRKKGEFLKEFVGAWENTPIIIFENPLDYIKKDNIKHQTKFSILDAWQTDSFLLVQIANDAGGELVYCFSYSGQGEWWAEYYRVRIDKKFEDIISSIKGRFWQNSSNKMEVYSVNYQQEDSVLSLYYIKYDSRYYYRDEKNLTEELDPPRWLRTILPK